MILENKVFQNLKLFQNISKIIAPKMLFLQIEKIKFWYFFTNCQQLKSQGAGIP
jgi:hypothetical protein